MAMVELIETFDLPILAAIFAGLLMFGLIFYFWQARSQSQARSERAARTVSTTANNSAIIAASSDGAKLSHSSWA